jgi:DMSO/TMAO reductase YedYZ molybdopterin-dependent catalytic subunit
MNGGDLPVDHGAPVRLRLTRQLGYKNVKYLSRIVVTDNLDQYGTRNSPRSATWYGGI